MSRVLYLFCFYCCLVYGQQPDLEEITQWAETQNNAENPPEFVSLEWFNDVKKDNLQNILHEAQNGSFSALRTLIFVYNGWVEDSDILPDFIQAKLWLEEGVKKEEPFSLFLQATNFEKENDHSNYLKYLKLSADKGYAIAQNFLAKFYASQDPLTTEALNNAIKYYFLASKQGNEESISELAYALDKLVDVNLKKTVVNLLEISYKLGNDTSVSNLGYRFSKGINGWKHDLERAFYYFQLAAKQNSTIGLYNLGVCYQNGEGCKKDFDKAIECYEKALLDKTFFNENPIYLRDNVVNLWICYDKKGYGWKQVTLYFNYINEFSKEKGIDGFMSKLILKWIICLIVVIITCANYIYKFFAKRKHNKNKQAN